MKTSSFKYRVRKKLESDGFSVAPVADADYPADLLAIRNGRTHAYLCKAHGRINRPELERLRAFSQIFRIQFFIAKETFPERAIQILALDEYAQRFAIAK